MEIPNRTNAVQTLPDPHGCSGVPPWLSLLGQGIVALAGAIASFFAYKKGKLGRPASIQREFTEIKNELKAQRDEVNALMNRAHEQDTRSMLLDVVREEVPRILRDILRDGHGTTH